MMSIRFSSLACIYLLSFDLFANDFSVELSWNTDDLSEVLNTMPEQKDAFGKLIEDGVIKDMFITNSKINNTPVRLLRFVIQGDDIPNVKNKLKGLPLYKKDLLKIINVKPMGAKWLDNTPILNNYGVTFTWKDGIDPMEIDRVLSVDLQRVIALNQAGLITSSYLNTQTFENGTIRPIYSVSFLADDAKHAYELSKQFEAVMLGYANTEVQYLGRKIKIDY